jgi:hypothetical protein
MSSSRESDRGEEQDRKPQGFVRSVLKVLSGSRFTPSEGFAGDRPSGDYSGEGQPSRHRVIAQISDGAGDQTPPVRESLSS